MGRPPRLTYAGAMHHVTMRCNNKEFLFDEESQTMYLHLLHETCDRFELPLYNFCLMTNHAHLLFRVPADDSLSRSMHRLQSTFSNRFNRARGRKGHLWEGRFVSTVVEEYSYFLRCMAYIDVNPVRAGIVTQPGDYRWSGHRHLAAEDESIITLHPSYLALGDTPEARYTNYRRILAAELDREAYSLAGTLVVGTEHFVRGIEERFGIAEGSRFCRHELGAGVQALEPLKGRPERVPGTD
ncbi:MAG: REP-associated tyrosine transposase [Planctomycetota bacterium]